MIPNYAHHFLRRARSTRCVCAEIGVPKSHVERPGEAPRSARDEQVQNSRAKLAAQDHSHAVPDPEPGLSFPGVMQERRSKQVRLVVAAPKETTVNVEAVALV